jgi:hypothetical protein
MKTDWTKDVRLPGILYVVILVGGTWYAENYLSDPRWLEAILLVAPIIGKIIFPGTGQMEGVLNLAKQILSVLPPAPRHVRVAPGESAPPTLQPSVGVDSRDIEKLKPNKVARMFLG